MNSHRVNLLIANIENNLELLKLELSEKKESIKNDSEESNIIKLSLEDLLKQDNYQLGSDIEYYEEPI